MPSSCWRVLFLVFLFRQQKHALFTKYVRAELKTLFLSNKPEYKTLEIFFSSSSGVNSLPFISAFGIAVFLGVSIGFF